MSKKAKQQPSDLELQVLSVLWENEPLTVRQVRELMPDGKERAYTTVLSVMQLMGKKGFITHKSDGVRHVYRSVVKKRDVLSPMLRGMVQNFFRGSPAAVMQHLLEGSDVSSEELAEVRQVLEACEGKNNNLPKKGERK